MTESLLIYLSIITLFLPLLGFAVVILFGKKIPKLYKFEIGIITAALAASIFIAIVKLSVYVDTTIVAAFTWIDFGDVPLLGAVKVDLGIMIDNLTALMLIVVNLISYLVHVYSVEYMQGDKRFNRYFAYLGIFTFSMLGIVLTHNILMMYIFWELVGLSSYLLIGFWYEKKSASDAGKKAFIVNRVGDLGFFHRCADSFQPI